MVNFGSQEVKGQSHKAKVRFGGLAEAPFSKPLGREAFLVVVESSILLAIVLRDVQQNIQQLNINIE